MLWKCYTQYASKFGKFSSGHKTGKGQFSFQSPKECSNYCTIALISHDSKIILKILQARLQHYVNWESQMFTLDLEKSEKPDINLLTSIGSQKNQENSRKSSISASLTVLQPFTVCITTNWAKFKRWEYQNTLLASWENWMQIKKQQLEQDMEQWTGSKLGKEYIKVVYCQPAYLTYMQSTSCKMPGWIKHKLESRLLGEISITSDTQRTPPLWQKVKNN